MGVWEYKLICDAAPPRPLPFPPCVHTSWEPGDSASMYALVSLQKGAILKTVKGLAEVRLKAPRELRFTAKLKNNDMKEDVRRMIRLILVLCIFGTFQLLDLPTLLTSLLA